MMECIFQPYFTKSVECDRAYKCEGCEVRETVRGLVKEILDKKKELKCSDM